ncbi:MAG: hypothetical protein K9L60_07860 [Methylovulum sp.]|jgi:hypothetical protein|nr:hypothetical protein [Methylovulum sp.]MCF7998366.1 hypothetical protein [Methylovulum sp.]
MTTKILAPEQILCLKSQQFSDTEPGTLLKDFSSLLDFIGSTGIPVSKENHLLAIKLLPQLNQLMSNPLDVKLKRPPAKIFSSHQWPVFIAEGFWFIRNRYRKERSQVNTG